MKADFAMAIHFHQPVGNFDHVFERACDKCYIPFLETLKKYPDIKMSFHFTGCLLEWAEGKRPEIIDMVRAMVGSGQVEVISGGFYEPILPSIPPKDRISQISMLSGYIRDRLSYEPKGAWVAERVWEPCLPSVLHDAGIKYIILDDTHFLYSGVAKEKTYGYYITEDNGKTVAVFPSDKVLRYHIPFKMPAECMDYMRGVLRANSDAMFIYGDDGEKFGEWPGTHKWVFEEKWLEKFFDEIMRNSDWLNTVTFSECLDKKAPLGRVYLPTSSYEEMLEWALPAESQQHLEDVIKDLPQSGREDFYKPFIRGGFWRNFLTKYPESNHMNKKMVYVSKKLDNLRLKKMKKPDLVEAEKELFRGQCNCAYWHGVFGGLYLYHLRNAIYQHLIKSETLIDRVSYGKRSYCRAEVLDIDADGLDEVVLENRELALYFDPAEGGILKELDSKKNCQNFINTLARRKESYHRNILEKIEAESPEELEKIKTIHDDIRVVNPGIKDYLRYDRYGRYSLVDHFLGSDADIDSFSRCDHNEAGDFVNGSYDFDLRKASGEITLVMKRDGLVAGAAAAVIKEITLPKKGACVSVKYIVTNKEAGAVNFIFGPEFNVTMPEADSDRYSLVLDGGETGYSLGKKVKYDGASQIEIPGR